MLLSANQPHCSHQDRETFILILTSLFPWQTFPSIQNKMSSSSTSSSLKNQKSLFFYLSDITIILKERFPGLLPQLIQSSRPLATGLLCELIFIILIQAYKGYSRHGLGIKGTMWTFQTGAFSIVGAHNGIVVKSSRGPLKLIVTVRWQEI